MTHAPTDEWANLPRRDLTLPLVAIVAAMVAVTVMIWGVV